MPLINHVRPSGRLLCILGAFLLLGIHPAMTLSQTTQTTDESKAQPSSDTPEAQDQVTDQASDEKTPGTPGTHQRRGFNRSTGRRFLTGEYDLKIEIKPGNGDEPIVVLLDGEPVDAGTAAFFMRIIRQKKVSSWRNRKHGNGPGPGNRTVDHGPPAPPGMMPETDYFVGRASSSPERIDEVMSVVRDFDPNLYGRLLSLQRDENDPRFATEIDRLSFEYAGEIRLYRRDEEGYALRVKERQMETDLQALQFEIGMVQPKDEDEISKYRQKVSTLLSAKFDVQQEMRDRELSKMVSRLEGLKERLKERAAQRDRFVKERTDEILRELLMDDK